MCPGCSSDNAVYMGRLGRKVWYRCRDCGLEFSLESGEIEEEKVDARS